MADSVKNPIRYVVEEAAIANWQGLSPAPTVWYAYPIDASGKVGRCAGMFYTKQDLEAFIQAPALRQLEAIRKACGLEPTVGATMRERTYKETAFGRFQSAMYKILKRGV